MDCRRANPLLHRGACSSGYLICRSPKSRFGSCLSSGCVDARCDGRADIHDRSENLYHTDQGLPLGKIDCCDLIFSGKCTMRERWMDCDQILKQLKSLSNQDAVAGMARFGINPKNPYGVSIPVLRKMAKQIGRNHLLA